MLCTCTVCELLVCIGAFYQLQTSEKKKKSKINIYLIPTRDPSILAECGLDDETKEVLLNNIKRKLTSQAVKIRADIEVACYGYEGIDAVKTALKAGLACSTEELPIKINLIAPPLYGNILWIMLLIQSMFLASDLFWSPFSYQNDQKVRIIYHGGKPFFLKFLITFLIQVCWQL
jgi:hypothetical protein